MTKIANMSQSIFHSGNFSTTITTVVDVVIVEEGRDDYKVSSRSFDRDLPPMPQGERGSKLDRDSRDGHAHHRANVVRDEMTLMLLDLGVEVQRDERVHVYDHRAPLSDFVK